MSGSRTQPSQPPKGHPDPASLEYLCHFPGDLVAAPSAGVLDGSEAAGLAQDAHQQLDELFRDRLRESVGRGAMALWGSLDEGAPRGYGHACPVLLAGPSRKVPAVLRARRDCQDLELDLFVRVPRSVARHNGMALPAKDPGYDETDAPERPYAVIRLTESQARRLLANAKAYKHGACQHPHVSSILLNMSAKHLLARSTLAPAAGAAPLAATRLNLVCLPPLDGDLEKCLCMLGHSRSFAADGNGSDSDDAKSDSAPLNLVLDSKVWSKSVARSEEIAALFRRCGEHPLLQADEVAELLTSSKWHAPESAFADAIRTLVRPPPPPPDDLQPSSGDEDNGTVSPPPPVATAAHSSDRAAGFAKGKRKAPPPLEGSDDDDDDDEELEEPPETSEEEDEEEEEDDDSEDDASALEPPAKRPRGQQPPMARPRAPAATMPTPCSSPASAPAPTHDDLTYLRAQLRTTAIPALQRLLAPAVRERLGFFAAPLEENMANLMRTDSGHEAPHVAATLVHTIVNMGHAFAHLAEQRDAEGRVSMPASEATRIRALAEQAHAVTNDTLPKIHDALRQAQALEQALLDLKTRGGAVLAGIAQGGPVAAAAAAEANEAER